MTELVADFHRLESRLRLTGSLITRTALRIGGGGGDLDGVDLPVLKDAAGRPFIPGASLKGALRATVESLVRAVDGPADLWACDPLAIKPASAMAGGADALAATDRGRDTIAVADPRARSSGYHRISCGYHERGKRSDVKPEDHCAACRLFGSHVVASHVRFCDALLQPPGQDGATARRLVEIRDGVAIDRDLRRVRGATKYDFEVVAPGAAFGVEVFVDNPQPWLMGLLAVGFDQLAEGFTALGGFTSRGLGRVTFAWSSIRRFTAHALLHGEAPTDLTGDALATEIQQWRDALARRAREVV